MNRREKRFYQRQNQKVSTRKIDRNKLYKTLKELTVISVIFFVFVFSATYFIVNDQNNTRTIISQNPKIINTKVLDISGKMSTASYEFIVNGKKFRGSTYNAYNGNVGDDISIIYSTKKPTYNVYYKEKEIVNIKENVVFFSFKILGIYIGFIFLYLLYEALIGNKILIAKITSKK